MMVSGKKNRLNLCWVLLCALILLPLGAAFALDYEAVEKRLAMGVIAGELSLEEAAIMIDALKETEHDKKPAAKKCDRPAVKDIDMDAVGRRIRAAVQSGSMTAEEGRAKMIAIKKGHAKKDAPKKDVVRKDACKKTDKACDVRTGASKKAATKKKPVDARKNIDFENAWKRLQGAVKAGKMSKEDAMAKMSAIKKQTFKKAKEIGHKAKNKADDFNLEAIGKEIKAAVEAGKITADQGWEKWQWVKKNELAPRLEAAMKAGELTKQQVMKIWKDIEKAEVGEKLRSAVASGEITEEAARKRWHEYEKRSEEKPDERLAKYKHLEARIRGAVEAGHMSRQEAGKKLEAARKEMWPDRKPGKVRDSRK